MRPGPNPGSTLQPPPPSLTILHRPERVAPTCVTPRPRPTPLNHVIHLTLMGNQILAHSPRAMSRTLGTLKDQLTPTSKSQV